MVEHFYVFNMRGQATSSVFVLLRIVRLIKLITNLIYITKQILFVKHGFESLVLFFNLYLIN